MTTLETRSETEADIPALYDLASLAFGPGRFARTAYRVREGVAPVPALSLTAWRGDRLVGGVRFTAVRVGDARGGLMLGPLLVHPDVKGNGCGQVLVQNGLTRARDKGFAFVVLVGDLPYYSRFGFAPVPHQKIFLPGPVDPARLLSLELRAGAMEKAVGLVKAHAP